MEIIDLKCNNCGANLSVKTQTKFCTCTFCGSSLAIVKSGDTAFTEVLEELNKKTDILMEDSKSLMLEKDLSQLEREWEFEKESYTVSGMAGDGIPNLVHVIFHILLTALLIAFIIFGIFFLEPSTPDRYNRQASLMFILLGIGAIFLIGYTALITTRHLNYEKAVEEYIKRRDILLNNIKNSRS